MICNVVGARPNFMKMSPVVDELRRRGIPQMLVHTGQHYDRQMSTVFFEELGSLLLMYILGSVPGLMPGKRLRS